MVFNDAINLRQKEPQKSNLLGSSASSGELRVIYASGRGWCHDLLKLAKQPLLVPENLPYLIDRMNIVAERMLWADMVTQEEYDATYIPAEEYLDESSHTDAEGTKHFVLKDGFLPNRTAETKILEGSPADTRYRHLHFVEYVIDQVRPSKN